MSLTAAGLVRERGAHLANIVIVLIGHELASSRNHQTSHIHVRESFKETAESSMEAPSVLPAFSSSFSAVPWLARCLARTVYCP